MNDKDKKPVTIESIISAVKSYQPDADFGMIERAYLVANEGHKDQVRASGEPYIIHPLNVAAILTELQLDDTTIAAAILHDVVEDTLFTLNEITKMFGEEVALLIDGVTKIGKIPISLVKKTDTQQKTKVDAERAKLKEEQTLETYRKMIIAMAKDIRVIMIKLADRLHNMRTLKFMRADKQKRIARETLEIYAPLANRLGISNIKWELEDLSLRYLDPDAYYNLVKNVDQKRKDRQIYITEAVKQIEEEFDDLDIHASISGRAKHFYSIYKKMIRENKEIGGIYDLYAVRILVDTVQDCYNVLGVIHSRWKPIPGRIKDYIAVPKSNGYRSLHTTVMVLGYPLEIQIRTYAMHQISEYGVAAHWKYKEAGKSVRTNSADQKMSWLHQMVQLQREIKDPKEYLEALKIDIFSDEIFVFTPAGDLISLPQGSNPIDFAYRIHSQVGHHCVGAKVNGKMVPLEYKLHTGDYVEIITNRSNNGPSQDWLNIVASSDTRAKIRSWFKKENREENILHGQQLISDELKKLNYSPKDLLKDNRLEKIAAQMNIGTEEDLLAQVGYNSAHLNGIILKLLEMHKKEVDTAEPSAILKEIRPTSRVAKGKAEGGILVEGESGFVVRLAKCCNPIPGDEISGYVTRGRGVSVHRVDCPNILKGIELNRMIEVSWANSKDDKYTVELEIVCNDKSGVLAEILALPATMQLNIQSVHATPNKSNKTSTVRLGIEVKNSDEVSRIMTNMRRIKDIYSVTRPINPASD